MRTFLFFLIFALVISCNAIQEDIPPKPKLIVTTDLGQDPDDQQSMIRLLHYANEFELLGFVANGDGNYEHESAEVRTDLMYQLLDAYATIQDNLKKVDASYPIAQELRQKVKAGCAGNGRDIPVENYIGEGKNTPGSDWIIQQVDAHETTINLAVWGGACDLAQALFDVRQQRTPEAVSAFVKKLRVYFIGKQDSSNQWIIDNFPELWLVLALSYDDNAWNSTYRGIFLDGDESLTSLDWLQENVISQNALGALYPKETWTKGGTKNPYGAMKEGDTPSFLFFLNNGLNNSNNPKWGGWGGRFEKVGSNFYRDAEDTFYDKASDSVVTNGKATVFRWRPDIQADFAARVQWGKGDDGSINHYPKIRFNGKKTNGSPIFLKVFSGEVITLSAEGSSDSYDDELTYSWMVYPKAGTFPHPSDEFLSSTKGITTELQLPDVGKGSLHLILRVTDDADYPLTTYQRVILRVE